MRLNNVTRGALHNAPHGLCGTCDLSHVRRSDDGSILVLCQSVEHEFSVVRRPVTECSGYRDKNTPSLHEMRDIAWNLRLDKKRGTVGFDPPKRRQEDDDDLD